MTRRFFWIPDDGWADRVALVDGATGAETTYGMLAERKRHFQDQLSEGRGLCLIYMTPTVDCIALYLAALEMACPVILSAPMDAEDLAKLDAAFPPLYVFDPSQGHLVIRPEGRGLDLHPDLCLMLSTSGSTGARKFVRLSAENLASNAAAIAEYLDLGPGDCAPTALPLTYSYGMSVLNSHLHVGARLVLTDEPVISDSFWEMFRRTGCTSFAGVPQSFSLLARSGHLDQEYPALRYVTQAGGKLGPEAVKALAETGDRCGWKFYVMYGQTEAAPRIAYLPPEAARIHPGAIGRAIPGGELRIEDEDGTPVTTPGVEGELVYRGPNVMMGYATEAADLAKPADTDRLHTGDLGYVDENGLFFITGRRSRFLKLSGKRVSLEEIDVWLAEQDVDGVAVGRDDALGLVHTAATPLADRVAAFLDVPQSQVHDIPVDRLPLNQNGKIDLPAAQAAMDAALKKAAPAQNEPGGAGLSPETVMSIFRRQFPGATITPETSFQSLGGTSNDFVDVELALEAAGLDMPSNWQAYSIADLAQRVSDVAPSDRPVAPDYASARVVCTLLVVLLHVVGFNSQSGLELPPDALLHRINDWLDPLRMPMFAFLAGFSFWTMDTPANAPGSFVRTLLGTLLIPTVIAMTAFAGLSTVVGTAFAIRSPGDALALLYLPYAHFWFIMTLTLMLITSYLLFRYWPRAPQIPFVLLAAIFLLVYQPYVPSNPWAINRVFDLLPIFVVGYFYAQHWERIFGQYRRPVLACAALVIVVLSIIPPDRFGPLSELAALLLSLGMIALCLGFAGRIPGLRWLAPYAFFIYLWHILGTSGMRRVLEGLGVDQLPVMVIAGVLAGTLFPVVLYHVLGYLPGGRVVRGK